MVQLIFAIGHGAAEVAVQPVAPAAAVEPVVDTSPPALAVESEPTALNLDEISRGLGFTLSGSFLASTSGSHPVAIRLPSC
jgi:hypothetical protein